MEYEQKQIILQHDIAACVTWQKHMQKPFWSFTWIDLIREAAGLGEFVQACLLGGQDATETLYRGIMKYNLPLPLDETEKAKFLEWCKSTGQKHITQLMEEYRAEIYNVLTDIFPDWQHVWIEEIEPLQLGVIVHDNTNYLNITDETTQSAIYGWFEDEETYSRSELLPEDI